MNQIEKFDHPFSFHGQGLKLFVILVVNVFLTIITLGIYYPWAKAALMRFYAQETEFAESRFMFHGTGKEMFLGYLKALGLFIAALVILAIVGSIFPPLAALLYFVFIFGVIPFAIHGSLRYRASRTSWRGIHFGYRGKLKELLKIYFKGLFLTLITVGIYGPWFTINVRKYIIDNMRFGNVEMTYSGKGSEFFWVVIKGFFLTILTLGIYSFWYSKDLIHYTINHIHWHQGMNVSKMKSHITVGAIFTNFLFAFAVILTAGIALPWYIIHSIKVVTDSTELRGEFDPNKIAQTEEEYKDATGEDMLDMLDISLDI
ncbi:MAG: YjgN family protein [Chitinophagales bacterium]